MKKMLVILILVSVALFATTLIVSADAPVRFDSEGKEVAWEQSNSNCASIQDGIIFDSSGLPITTGFDQFGYNYQAHMFNGTYDSVDRILDGKYWGATGDYVDDKLMMKWSDEWLANVDCNDDHKLDRGLVDGVVGGKSIGWETNMVEGDYDSNGDGTQDAHYTYFAKIVWTGPGSPLWNEFTLIEEVYNDPVAGLTGISTKVGAPGFGLNDHWTE